QLPEAIENAGNAVEKAEKAYNESVDEYEKALKELKPENHPSSVKKIYDELEEAKKLYDEVTTKPEVAELTNAEARYKSAYYEYINIDMYVAAYGEYKAEEIKNEYTAAKSALAEIEKKYDKDNLKEQIESLEIQYADAVANLEKALKTAEKAKETAKENYDNALKSQQKTDKSNETSKDDYSDAVKDAEKALEDAKKNYELAVEQAEADLASLKKAAEQQRTLSGLNNPQLTILENLKEKLEYAVVVAPCDGIVTAVNAEEGVMASGAIFVIEDLSNLKVSASVGEYDIPYVSEGMTATVKCDAVSGVEYDGKVSSVAPTGVPGNSGTSYAIEADIDGEDGKILVGMSAKLAIISDKRENALTITYDARTTDENGNDAVYIAEKDENGVYHAKLVTVEIGLETDYEIEIISDEISEGMYVLTNTTMLSDGDVVVINENEEESETNSEVAE
ncbi:MAG: efflux RND transporter periplasmic adaptor subunit, partial [Oscillospiraceae bacterium]|nr:efflux RND transporter periplasmic adaptor subunit [Oscillospiraceae bacterium]